MASPDTQNITNVADSSEMQGKMVKPVLALLTIGQSPRPAFEAEFRYVLGERCEFRMLGALDHLNQEEIAQYKPDSGADTLLTSLRTGETILTSHRLVTEGLSLRLDALEALDIPVALLCCTGEFPELQRPGLYMASEIISEAVSTTVSQGCRLGMFVPNETQIESAKARWGDKGYIIGAVPRAPDAGAWRD